MAGSAWALELTTTMKAIRNSRFNMVRPPGDPG
jgi:hypothetical protein